MKCDNPPPTPSHKRFQGEGTKRDKKEFTNKGDKIRRGSEGLFLFLSRAVFVLPNPFFQEVKSNQKSSSCPVMYFTLICVMTEKEHMAKNRPDRVS